jgi:Ca-activated chloride channel homolog
MPPALSRSEARVVNGGTGSIVPSFLRLALAVGALASLNRQHPSAQFASGINLVEVYATVTDTEGELVTTLGIDDFQVNEDGRPQSITVFAGGDFALTVAIAVDHSFSMSREALSTAKSAATAFIRELRTSDRLMVMGIGSETEIVAPLSSDRQRAVEALNALSPWGTTPLYDSILTALDMVQAGTGRRALVLLTDGIDRYSRASAAELVDRGRHQDLLVYPVALAKSIAPILVELASVTGGRSFRASDRPHAASALAAIARELRFQYLLGYTPSRTDRRAGTPGWRSIQVSVRRPNLRVRARDGYEVR